MPKELETFPCDTCGKLFPIRLLDAKPYSLLGIQTTHEMLAEADSAGESFDALECKTCYGPAWVNGINIV